MKTKNILFLHPYKFRKFDWHRFECEFLERKYNIKIHIHELIDVIYPHFKKAWSSEMIDKNIKIFNDIKSWRIAFSELIKKDPNILIMNHVKPINLKSIQILLELKKFKVRDYFFASPGFPDSNLPYNLKNIIKKIFWFLINPKPFGFFIRDNFFKILGKIFVLNPKFALKTGTENFLGKKDSLIIRASSHDFSNFLIIKKEKNLKKIERKNVLFLEKPGPMFPSDNLITKKKMSDFFTVEKWYPSICKFFDLLEKYFSTEVKIAPHPKTNHEKFPKYYGGREVISERLAYASLSAKFLVSIDSTGLSYSVMNKIPAIMVYSDELKKNDTLRSRQKFYADKLGVTPINIDGKFSLEQIQNNLIIDKKKYNEYTKKYLTSREDFMSNYDVLSDIDNNR